jgi:hypothetical protein
MVLYLERRLGAALPCALGALAACWRERAVAFAVALFRAGKLAVKRPRHPSNRLWNAMASVPFELRQRIAFEAQLIYPEALVRPRDPGAVVEAGRCR